MLAPAMLVQPHEGYGAQFPRISDVAPDFRLLATQLRGRPVGQYVLRMFAEERKQK